MALKDQLFIGGIWVDTDVRGSNITGDVIVTSVLTGSGEEIPDTYSLIVSARSGGTGTVTIGSSSSNPYDGRVKTGLAFDDATEYTDLIPGTTIVLDNGAANADEAEIVVGNPYGSFDASGVGAGVPTAEVQHKVVNDGDSAVAEARASLLPQAAQVKMIGKVFDFISPYAPDAVEKTAGGGSDRIMPYEMTISGVSGSGGSKIATLSVDGSAFAADTLLDLTTGTNVSGTGIKAIGPTYPYRVIDGPLEGLKFAIDADCVDGDEANILIFPSRFIQIAEDIAGTAGTYGISDVDITESGESTGVITPAGEAFFWTRFLVPASSNSESNPYIANVALVASQSTAAGWEE